MFMGMGVQDRWQAAFNLFLRIVLHSCCLQEVHHLSIVLSGGVRNLNGTTPYGPMYSYLFQRKTILVFSALKTIIICDHHFWNGLVPRWSKRRIILYVSNNYLIFIKKVLLLFYLNLSFVKIFVILIIVLFYGANIIISKIVFTPSNCLITNNIINNVRILLWTFNNIWFTFFEIWVLLITHLIHYLPIFTYNNNNS